MVGQQEQQVHDVLSILLEAQHMLDQSVVCKLMCCSNALSQLVYATCAGKTVLLLVQCAGAGAGAVKHKGPLVMGVTQPVDIAHHAVFTLLLTSM